MWLKCRHNKTWKWFYKKKKKMSTLSESMFVINGIITEKTCFSGNETINDSLFILFFFFWNFRSFLEIQFSDFILLNHRYLRIFYFSNFHNWRFQHIHTKMRKLFSYFIFMDGAQPKTVNDDLQHFFCFVSAFVLFLSGVIVSLLSKHHHPVVI